MTRRRIAGDQESPVTKRAAAGQDTVLHRKA